MGEDAIVQELDLRRRQPFAERADALLELMIDRSPGNAVIDRLQQHAIAGAMTRSKSPGGSRTVKDLPLHSTSSCA
jgi:hypothetical protein